MTETLFDDELESGAEGGRGKLLIAGLCFFLSVLCCVLWLVLLISPGILNHR